MQRRAIGEAASRGHPVSVCFSLGYASTLLLWTGDLPGASDLIEQLIVHAGRYSLEPYCALGIALKGELAISHEEPEAGLELLRSALGTPPAQQFNILIPGFIGAFAEGLRKTGQIRGGAFRDQWSHYSARQIVAWNLTCPNCFGLNRRFSRRDMIVHQP